MKILITGATGYLGGRLVEYLSGLAGYEISAGSRNVAESGTFADSISVVQTKWESDSALEDICSGVDVIVHLAGMNAIDCAADPVNALLFNGVVTGRLVRAASAKGVKKFLYISTAHIYKSPLSGTINEQTLPEAMHPYSTSHKAGEDMVLGAHSRGEIDGVVVRLSNAYGAPVTKDANCWSLLVNDLCRQAVSTNTMKMTSTGMQRRDFVAMTDVCRAIAHLIELPVSRPQNNLYNLGGNWSPTIWEMAMLIKERCKMILGFEPILTRQTPQAGEISAPLNYQIERLTKSGFNLGMDRLDEIDRLLLLCKKSFSGHRH